MKRTVILSVFVLLFAFAAMPALGNQSTSLLVALETPRTEVGSFAPASEERSFARQAEAILSAASIPLEEVISLPYLGLAMVRTSAPSGEALESLRQTPGVLQANLPGKKPPLRHPAAANLHPHGAAVQRTVVSPRHRLPHRLGHHSGRLHHGGGGA